MRWEQEGLLAIEDMEFLLLSIPLFARITPTKRSLGGRTAAVGGDCFASLAMTEWLSLRGAQRRSNPLDNGQTVDGGRQTAIGRAFQPAPCMHGDYFASLAITEWLSLRGAQRRSNPPRLWTIDRRRQTTVGQAFQPIPLPAGRLLSPRSAPPRFAPPHSARGKRGRRDMRFARGGRDR